MHYPFVLALLLSYMAAVETLNHYLCAMPLPFVLCALTGDMLHFLWEMEFILVKF